MVSSPTLESRSTRSGLKPQYLQENLDREVAGVKEGVTGGGEPVLQVSRSKSRSVSMGALSELRIFNSQPQQQQQQPAGNSIETPPKDNKTDVFELQGVPGMNDNSPPQGMSEFEGIETEAEELLSTTCSVPGVEATEEMEAYTTTPGRLIGSDVKPEPSPGDTLWQSTTDHVDEVMLEFREAVTALPPSFGVFLLQDMRKSSGTISDNSDELQKASPGKDSSGDWSDGGHRRIERVVPEETLRNPTEFDSVEDADLVRVPFSGPLSAVGYSGPITGPGFSGPISAAPGYSGPLYSNSGSLSRRSDSCNTSARSFAFPVLPGHEWNASPARMPPPDRSWGKKKGWRTWLCCATPATHP